MPARRRIQFLIDAEEFRLLRALARRRKTSVAELIRYAVREFYLKAPADRESLVKAILGFKLPNINWKKAKKEIETAHVGALGSAHK
jgi:hypothetical protein